MEKNYGNRYSIPNNTGIMFTLAYSGHQQGIGKTLDYMKEQGKIDFED